MKKKGGKKINVLFVKESFTELITALALSPKLSGELKDLMAATSVIVVFKRL